MSQAQPDTAKTRLVCGLVLISIFALFWLTVKWGFEYVHHYGVADAVGHIFKKQVGWFFATLLKMTLTVGTVWGLIWAYKAWKK